MPRKMSGIEMIVIEPSSVARSTASVALERAIHLYRSALEPVTPLNYTGKLYRLPADIGYTRAMTVETAPLAHELRETLGRLVRRLRAEPGEPPVAQLTVLGRLDR